MKSKRRFFIELLLTTINSSGFLFRSIPKTVFTSFLKLSGEYKAEKEKLKQKYEGFSKTSFEKNISVSEQEGKLENKIQSFQRCVDSISSVSSYDFYPNDALQKKYKDLYSYHRSKTGHIEGKPLTINRYREEDLITSDKKLKVIAKECVKVQLLKKIKDELEFSDIYTSSDLIIVDSVADACWEIFQADDNISREKLINRVMDEYFIKKYEDLPAKEREKKVKRTAQQWVNDNQENLQIT